MMFIENLSFTVIVANYYYVLGIALYYLMLHIGSDFTKTRDREEVLDVVHRLNSKARKCLDCATLYNLKKDSKQTKFYKLSV